MTHNDIYLCVLKSKHPIIRESGREKPTSKQQPRGLRKPPPHESNDGSFLNEEFHVCRDLPCLQRYPVESTVW